VTRPRINQWGATDREHQATWPGDHLVAQPSFVWTNAVTIQAPAAHIWPWLVQLGQGRGGLYGYDWLENLISCDVHSADRILPEFQHPMQVGDRVIRMARYAPWAPVALFHQSAPWSWGTSTTPARSCSPDAREAAGPSSFSRSIRTRPGCLSVAGAAR
jgi:hypothetical protein